MLDCILMCRKSFLQRGQVFLLGISPSLVAHWMRQSRWKVWELHSLRDFHIILVRFDTEIDNCLQHWQFSQFPTASLNPWQWNLFESYISNLKSLWDDRSLNKNFLAESDHADQSLNVKLFLRNNDDDICRLKPQICKMSSSLSVSVRA